MSFVSSVWRRSGYVVLFVASVGLGAIATVAVLVHTAPDLRVPKVVGQTTEAAMRFVAAQHLTLHAAGERFSDEFPRGIILEQLIAPGERVRPGRSVGIVVSLGARDRIAPHVVGVKWEAAEVILRTAELKVSEIVRSCSDHTPAGSLISQEPPAGNPVVARSMTLLMSTGPCRAQFVMSHVVGGDLHKVTDEMERQGFRNRGLNYVSGEDSPPGSITSVLPVEGIWVEPRDVLALTIAAPAPPSSEEISSGTLRFLRVTPPPGFFGHLIRVHSEGTGAFSSTTRERQVSSGEPWEEITWVPPDANVWVEVDGRRIWSRID